MADLTGILGSILSGLNLFEDLPSAINLVNEGEYEDGQEGYDYANQAIQPQQSTSNSGFTADSYGLADEGNFPNVESMIADSDIVNRDSEESDNGDNLSPSFLDRFSQAQEDYFNTQNSQAPATINVEAILPFESAKDDFNKVMQDQASEDLKSGMLSYANLKDLQNEFIQDENNLLAQQANDQIDFNHSVNDAREDYLGREAEQFKNMQGMPFNLGITPDEYKQKYIDLFNSKGGLEEGYRTGDKDIAAGLGDLYLQSSYLDRGELPPSELDGLGRMYGGLDRMSRENFDDGTMRADSVKGKYMPGSVYKEYVENGFGGRPVDQIEDDAVYNKVDEARNHGFIPYIEDLPQYAYWDATQLGDDITKSFNILGDARELGTDATIKYNDQNISRKAFDKQLANYADKAFNKETGWINGKAEILSPDDPAVKDSDIPAQKIWSINMDDGSTLSVSSPDSPQMQWVEDGGLAVWWPGTETEKKPIIYSEEEIENWDNVQPTYNYVPLYQLGKSKDVDRVDGYYPAENLTYRQDDGSEISLSFDDVMNIVDGNAEMDYGPFNIAKSSNERKGWADMFLTGDPSDFVPNFVDLAAGSAPLFFKSTAWPMAGSNAVTASQGLDPRLYNAEDNTYYRLSDDMTGDKYALNTILSGLVPATEHVAGIIGGGGGLLGKLIQKGLEKIGAPAFSRYGVDILGEGVEENVASTWEDLQAMGPAQWFADPIYKTDENGNVLLDDQGQPMIDYDSTGHEKRDTSTPLNKRFSNFLDQQLDNFIAGATLGGAIGVPTRVVPDYANGSGYAGESRERKMLRELEDENNVPRYREARVGDAVVRITPEDIGTYGTRRDQ